MAKYKLSPSSLNLFLDCPRCFWLQLNNGIRRPRGIYPSLPSGIDGTLKKYFDSYRIKDILPKEIQGIIQGKLFPDLETLGKWRDWKNTNLFYEDKSINAVLSGALDDCIVNGHYYAPLDYKTRGSALKEDSASYYQNQLDCYCLMLDANGYATNGVAYLVYYWPQEVMDSGIIKFNIAPVKITTNIETAKKTFKDAVALLLSQIPQASPTCEYCGFLTKRNSF